jgi:deoxyribose-phosphate aldolase
MNYASYIDHTLLKQDATLAQIKQLCLEAKQFQFASVCVQPHYVKLAANELKGTHVKVCTVIGFPLGSNNTAIKVAETTLAIEQGAQEIDMVINISWLKDNHDQKIVEEINRIKQACGSNLLKVILETCLLTVEEKIRACNLAKQAGADFVKTSTGFSTGGATIEDIVLMRTTVGPKLGVKASGGIKSFTDMQAMIHAGATRIGTSSGVKLLESGRADQGY